MAVNGGAEDPTPAVPPPPLANRGNFGARLTGDATATEGDAKGEDMKGDAADETHADYVIFTDNAVKRYEDFAPDEIVKTDDNFGIRYERAEIYDETVLLLQFNCPDHECDVACMGWADLHRHVKSVHHKLMCNLCTQNKKVFTHEHELFTPAELRKHQKFGDDNPGAIDQTGFKGHPECGFCHERFYGDDELYAHCRDKHERCHICDRRSSGRQQQYYVDYDALEIHFRKDHFLCPDRECLERKFVVFESEMDLKAHQLEVHPNGMTKDARRDARRVDVSGFAYRQSQEQERSNRREGRGRGRGRDPNTEALPASSAQPLRRDELAYQRQMAIQSAQSVSTRNFGGQLTSTDTYAARPPPRAEEPATVAAAQPVGTTETFPSLASLNLGTNSAAPLARAPLTPQEQARQLRHTAVQERAANMLRNDQTKLTEFRNRVSSYKSSSITATELVDYFVTLFDNTKELGKLVKELAEIFEIPSKRDNLLKAWSDWKAINEDYPILPGPSQGASASTTSSVGHGGSRVLRLKSSTAQSSRSAANRQGSWGSAGEGGLFPPLAAGASASANRAGAGRVGPVPWAGASASPRPSPIPSRVASSTTLNRSAPAGTDAFPALPQAKKPTSTAFTPGYTGYGIRRDNSGRSTPLNPWGAGASAAGSSSADADLEAEAATEPKKKGNKNKKQTLPLAIIGSLSNDEDDMQYILQ
ncbi:hypothetical protein H2199_003284 [Coniosporium tulheliwenetii]|uniref:Uncharacterized protein n=1 Tax=Coniosporium tulheliwenetii TaxID=3383036 RepID=A0ACC2ZD99_9PEZI|nr:hypothetical protein H2199_003284 [Cladosporium sp. JES 115]